jgi:type II secretory pathway pseudopilin PulG
MTAAASPIRIGKQRGFTYLSVVILVAVIGLVGAATLRLGVTMQRAAAEEELLRIGAEFSDALQSYAAATPPGQPTFPPSLKELLKDPRFPQVRRHLRRIYVDPVTGKPEWGLMRAGINKPGSPGAAPGAALASAMSASEGGIIGIYSLSTSEPIKIGNFPQRFAGFNGKAHISDWKFTAETAQSPVTTAVKPPQNSAQPSNPLQPQPQQPPGMPPPMQTPKPAPQEPPQPAEPPPEPAAEPPEKAEPAPPPSEPESSANDPQR